MTTTNFFLPTEPFISHQTPHPAGGIETQTTLANTGSWIPPSPATEFRGITPHPWPAPLPSQGPEVPPVQISDAVISSLRSSLGGPEEPPAPTPAALRLFLGTYFDVFNVHLPLLHAPSFDADSQPAGLLLAMAAVGALYRLERRAVGALYRAADAAAPVGASQIQVGSFHLGTSGEGPSCPGKWHSLAYYQTRLLLQCVGILGGDSELAERSLGMIAELSLTVRRI